MPQERHSPSEPIKTRVEYGYNRVQEITSGTLGSDTAHITIATELTRFYNDLNRGFFLGDAVADLIMGVAVKGQKGTQRYSRQIVAQGIEPNILFASGNNAKIALDRALENGLRILFEDKEFLSALVASSGAMPRTK